LGKRKESSVRSMAGESIRDRPPADTEQTEDTETISHKDTEILLFKEKLCVPVANLCRRLPPLGVSKKQKPRGNSIIGPLWHDGPQ